VGTYSAANRTYAIVKEAPFTEGVMLREVLDEVGYEFEYAPREGGGGIVTLHLSGDRQAIMTLAPGETGLLEMDGKEAKFAFYSLDGYTYIVKDSFLKALEEIGAEKEAE